MAVARSRIFVYDHKQSTSFRKPTFSCRIRWEWQRRETPSTYGCELARAFYFFLGINQRLFRAMNSACSIFSGANIRDQSYCFHSLLVKIGTFTLLSTLDDFDRNLQFWYYEFHASDVWCHEYRIHSSFFTSSNNQQIIHPIKFEILLVSIDTFSLIWRFPILLHTLHFQSIQLLSQPRGY